MKATTETPAGDRPAGRVWVKCLGPRSVDEDHWFWSTDRCGHRMCPACREIAERIGTDRVCAQPRDD